MSSVQNQREMAMALDPKPNIFKLNVDCFEELFGWLSLKDLHAFGQTCKRLQQVAGYYFRLTYPGARVYFLSGGIIQCNGVQINGFSDYIENIEFHTYHLDCFNFVKTTEFKSLKKIKFVGIKFDEEKITCIKKFLNKVEIVKIYDCHFIDFYNEFLRYCTNMKHLLVDARKDFGYSWLIQHYPSLEKLSLKTCLGQKIDELTTFFKRNPNVQHFVTQYDLLLTNQHSIMASNVKLESLLITISKASDASRGLLNELREREVYKQLHVYTRVYDDVIHQFIPINSVEKLLSLKFLTSQMPFINLKEFVVMSCDDLEVEAIATSLVNLERILFGSARPYHISSFIRRSRKLSHIGVLTYGKEVPDLKLWNKDRVKLVGARKVALHLPEEVYLATKEATQNKDHKLIEIKRIDSFC